MDIHAQTSAAANPESVSPLERLMSAIFGEEEGKRMYRERNEKRNKALAEASDLLKENGKTGISLDDMAKYMVRQHNKEVNRFTEKHDQDSALNLWASYIIRNRIVQDAEDVNKTHYDVKEAERRVSVILRIIELMRLGAPEIIIKAERAKVDYGNPALLDKVMDELDGLVNREDKPFGYTINHISSGCSKFFVLKYSQDEEDSGSCCIEESGIYDSREEAENACGEDEWVDECDLNEWYSIIDPNGKNARNMLYPTKTRAIVFLLGILHDYTPWWNAYETVADLFKSASKHDTNEGG